MRAYINIFLTLLKPITRFLRQYKSSNSTQKEKSKQMMASEEHPASIIETFMLLMDRDLAYKVSLMAINKHKIADSVQQDEKESSMQLRSKDEEISIKISSLTRHSSQVLISSTANKDNIGKIILFLKEKEHSFMQY